LPLLNLKVTRTISSERVFITENVQEESETEDE